MTQRQIVIGDVHGHYDTLITLLEKVAPSKEDQVYFLGDLIDRGPKSAQVVDFVMNSGYPCLLGNHEQMLLEVLGGERVSVEHFSSWASRIGRETVASYGQGVPKKHLDWLKRLPLYLDLGEFWLVHAGVHPQIALEKQTQEHFCWVREEFHSLRKPYFPDKLIITGHTITFTLSGVFPGQLAQGEGWLNIDTGAYHPLSGWLTALDLTNKEVYQANVFKGTTRQLPLAEATVKVNPAQMLHRSMMSQSS